METVKPITIDLSIGESLIVLTGLDHIINNTNYHELDRALADEIYKKIKKIVNDNSIEIGGE